jgi:hypothetical protein
MAGGKILDAKALRKIELNSESKPPIPKSSNLKFGAINRFMVVLTGNALMDINIVFISLNT